MSTTTDNSNPQAGSGRPLPKKEADLFKNVVKHYEQKQYKKAIKQADTILKKFPKHGETLAMKGLTLNYMAKREEAHTLVKEGLKNDMRSHVCWHVYGLLHRSDHDYNEAIKAYKQALRVDPQNIQIMRDLSMLQIQMRDLDGFAVTRNTLLTLKPNAKINWMAFALSRQLAGDLRGAIKIIDIYLGTLSEGSSELDRCFESSELAMYKNSVLAEIPNNYREALDHLSECESIIVDRGELLMKRAEFQFKLKDYDATIQTINELFKRGSTENHKAHSILMIALLQMDDSIYDEAVRLKGTQTVATMVCLSTEQKNKLLNYYKAELQPKHPQSTAVLRIPLTLLNDDELKQSIDGVCRLQLRKGVPSLCSELQSFLWTEVKGRLVRTKDPCDIKHHPRFIMFVSVVDDYISALASHNKFAASDDKEEESSTVLWTWFLRAGLHEMVGEYNESLILLDKCIEHTPTAVDVYEMKARSLKAIGELSDAVECLDKGRELDLQDRYINNQTTRYMLQAGREEDALKCISLFTRHEGNAEQNLYDMQCSWYELELAACYARKQDWGRSLKKYFAVVKHFDDFVEDQFDFHSYCLRKVTLRSYVSLLRYEDEVYGQSFFCEAARGIIRIFLHLHDNPVKDEDEEPDYSQMNAAEKKKAKAIVRKKKKASEKKDAELQPQKDENGNQKASKSTIKEDDPLGKQYLKKTPLEEAKKLSAMLARYDPNQLETWILQYDVATRRKKALMALQSLFKAKAIDSRCSDVFSRIVDFEMRKNSFECVDAVKTVVVEDSPKLLDLKSVLEYIDEAKSRVIENPLTDLPLRTEIAKAVVQVANGSVKDTISIITDGSMEARGVSLTSCQVAYDVLRSFGDEAENATKIWKEKVQQRFPGFI